MKIVKLLGGLGNQMFQYTFYKSLKSRFNNVKADISGYKNYRLHNGFELYRLFDVNLDEASEFIIKLYDPSVRDWYSRKLRRILNLKNVYVEEKTPFCLEKSLLKDSSNAFYWGYWQDPEYFSHIEVEIREDFQFKLPLTSQNKSLLDKIKLSNSVSIHVRRGDYLKEELLGGMCSIDYYLRAINLINNRIKHPLFFIFSDDVDWCKKNLTFNGPSIFVEGNQNKESYIDMQLMSNCKHNIIANSSFSWWGAWLNNNSEKIVIGPKKWVNNDSTNCIMPKTWIKL
ncbi:hypothetical protein ABIB40_000937 [Pedobacter sp. UYP30]|uniref:alpha-1,2-fucosyltransferase n=1 Tax=Pedobacter sp. UYP30 TaxID=1756400 RepID=UPI0033949C7A